jgi:uncharacterized membrane protein YphA (DoxX/SURF4 family)
MAVDRYLNTTWLVLRTAIGLMALLAGLDKFLNLLTNWPMYLSPIAERLSPLGGPALMRVFGVVEILVGLAILTKWTRLGAYVAMAWLVGIAINLVTTGMFFDVAVRDLELSVTAFTLARLTTMRDGIA